MKHSTVEKLEKLIVVAAVVGAGLFGYAISVDLRPYFENRQQQLEERAECGCE
jgi:hypothetical protein